jgi:hypothetical protein
MWLAKNLNPVNTGRLFWQLLGSSDVPICKYCQVRSIQANRPDLITARRVAFAW